VLGGGLFPFKRGRMGRDGKRDGGKRRREVT